MGANPFSSTYEVSYDPTIPSDPQELIGWANKRRETGHGVSEREAYL